MNKRTALFIGLAVAIAAVVVYRQIDRDARRINRRLTELKETLEKSAGAGQLRTLTQSRRVTGFFTPEVRITLQPVLSETIERDHIAPLLLQLHSRLDRLDIAIHDRQLEIDSAAETAIQRVTVRASASRGQRQERRVDGFEIQWVKIDGEWYIDRAEMIETIRAPGSAATHIRHPFTLISGV